MPQDGEQHLQPQTSSEGSVMPGSLGESGLLRKVQPPSRPAFYKMAPLELWNEIQNQQAEVSRRFNDLREAEARYDEMVAWLNLMEKKNA